MKRFLIMVTALLLAVSLFLSGCESDADREYREAQEAVRDAERAVEQARKNYDDLMDQINAYNAAMDRVNSSKP